MAKSRVKRIIKNIGLLLVSVIVCLIILEVIMRLFNPITPFDKYDKYHPDFQAQFEPDPVFGWSPKKNYHWFSYDEPGKLVEYTHNSQGIRGDKEYSLDKRDKKRIIVLGDSFVYGFSLNDNETYPYQLGEELGNEFEVINLAASGYGTDQALLKLIHVGLDFSLDIVIYGLYPNDINDNTMLKAYGVEKPMFFLENDSLVLYPMKDRYDPNTSVINKRTVSEMDAFLFSSSILYYFMHSKIANIRPSLGREKKQYKDGFHDSHTLIFVEKIRDPEYSKEYYESTAVGLKRTKALIKRMNDICLKRRIKFLVVYIPPELQISKAFRKRFVDMYSDLEEEDIDLIYKDKMLSFITNDREVRLLDLSETFEQGEAENGENILYQEFDSHWSALGTEKSAQSTVAYLRKERFI